MEEKTNVMRLLDQKKIPYKSHTYSGQEAVSGEEVAAVLGQDPRKVFKTLVTVAKSRQNYVFVIPVAEELDLKKAAKGDAESKRTASSHRLHSRRLFSYWDEEVF